MSKGYEYDVFISHAVEDKIDIVNELVKKLQEAGIKVWYSSDRLRVGRGVEETIKEGLSKSKHGIVVLTHNYFRGEWPKREFSVLWGREGSRIFPVWHNITKEEIDNYDTLLAGDWGLDTKKGIDYVVLGLVRAIRESEKPEEKDLIEDIKTTNRKPSGGIVKTILVLFFVLAVAAIAAWYFLIRDLPSDHLIETTIKERVDRFQNEILAVHELELNQREGKAATKDQIEAYHERYEGISAQYRNEYVFNTGFNEYTFKKNVEPALGKNIDLLTPVNNYNFDYPNIYVIDYKPSPHTMDVKYIFINTQPVRHVIEKEEKIDDYTYLVRVNYDNHIRYLSVDLTYSKRSDWMKKRHYTFQGLLPEEVYQFKKQDDEWVFTSIK